MAWHVKRVNAIVVEAIDTRMLKALREFSDTLDGLDKGFCSKLRFLIRAILLCVVGKHQCQPSFIFSSSSRTAFHTVLFFLLKAAYIIVNLANVTLLIRKR